MWEQLLWAELPLSPKVSSAMNKLPAYWGYLTSKTKRRRKWTCKSEGKNCRLKCFLNLP